MSVYMSSYKKHECELMPQRGIKIYTQFSETEGRLSISKLVVERLAAEEDLEENNVLEEKDESIWTFTAEIYCCPYCGSQLTAPSDINDEGVEDDERYGAFSVFDQENWSGRMR